jgi:hypothetical protein
MCYHTTFQSRSTRMVHQLYIRSIGDIYFAQSPCFSLLYFSPPLQPPWEKPHSVLRSITMQQFQVRSMQGHRFKVSCMWLTCLLILTPTDGICPTWLMISALYFFWCSETGTTSVDLAGDSFVSETSFNTKIMALGNVKKNWPLNIFKPAFQLCSTQGPFGSKKGLTQFILKSSKGTNPPAHIYKQPYFCSV